MLTIERAEQVRQGVPTLADREFDEKFHILQTPELFTPDLAFYRERPQAITRRATLLGPLQGEYTKTGGGLPVYIPVGSSDIEAGMLAAWQPNHPEHPEGAILLNVEHPVLQQVIEHWQAHYADHHAESIARDVIDVYGQVAVSKVTHSERLKAMLPSQVVEKELRSNASLTMALLGLMSEDHLISTRIGGKYSKKRHAVVGARRAHRPTAPR